VIWFNTVQIVILKYDHQTTNQKTHVF
jgi:hypothetical protein